jgi:hypothetical protein
VLDVLIYDDTPISKPTIGGAGKTTNPYGCDDMPFNMIAPKPKLPVFDVSEVNKQYIEYESMQA